MIDAPFVFTIFMLTLGPLKTIPAFAVLTKDAAAKDRRALAWKGVLLATIISLAVALVMQRVLLSWRVSLDDIRIAGGVLLFSSAMGVLSQFSAKSSPQPESAAKTSADTYKRMALSPLAIPTIVTPWGVVAILLFMGLAGDNRSLTLTVLALLLLIMVLNLLGMLAAGKIVGTIGLPVFEVLGWIFAVLQAGLAVEAVVISLRHLGIVTAG